MTQEMNNAQEVETAERLVTFKEAAQILGISVRGLYRLVDQRELPGALKVGRSARLSLSEVNAYIERLKEKRDAIARRSAGRGPFPCAGVKVR